MGDEAFKSKHRLSPHSFTRHRLLNFPTLILVLLNLRKSAAQVELDQFFKATEEQHHALKVVTKSAFFQARKQLSKQWVEIENFSGKSALCVQQDFHAKIVTMNLTALMTLAAPRRVEKKPNRKHRAFWAAR